MSDTRTQLVGLIGWPVEHSLSPAMHNTWFSALGLAGRYLLLPVRPEMLERKISSLAARGFRGVNVTIPYKQAVIPLLNGLSSEAKTIGAVNTIVVERDGRLIGHNTDSSGFITALRDSGFDPHARTAIVVGAGGGARAVVHALLAAGIHKISVLSRTIERAKELIHSFGDDRLHGKLLTEGTLREGTREADLLVNATSLGMWPYVDGSIWPHGTALPAHLHVFDLVYNPIETHLLKQARSSGARAISGIEMLIQQGAAAFALWTGKRAPLAVVRRALKEEAH